MGHPGIIKSNRVGVNTFWESSWYNNFSFKKNFKESFFSWYFLPYSLHGYFFLKTLVYKKNDFFLKSFKRNDFFLKSFYNFSRMSNFKMMVSYTSENHNDMIIGKCWYIKFNYKLYLIFNFLTIGGKIKKRSNCYIANNDYFFENF